VSASGDGVLPDQTPVTRIGVENAETLLADGESENDMSDGVTNDNLEDLLQMRERCADCAFRSGTNPQATLLINEMARLCVETGTLFMCHKNAATAGSPEVVCKGFMDAFAAKMQSGYYRQLPEWRRQVMRTVLDAIELAEHGGQPDLLQMIRDLPEDSR
jgi:hypothetical protein